MSMVSTVFPQSTLVQDPGPAGNPVTLNEPFDGGTNGGGWRMACIILASELSAALGSPLSQLANKPVTRLMCKAPAAGPVTGATYTNLTVRLGVTTNTAFPISVANFSGLYLQASNIVPPQVVTRLSSFTAWTLSFDNSAGFSEPLVFTITCSTSGVNSSPRAEYKSRYPATGSRDRSSWRTTMKDGCKFIIRATTR